MERDGLRPHPLYPVPVAQRVSSVPDLLKFLHRLLDPLQGGRDVRKAVFAFAGPVDRGKHVRMMNWQGGPPISLGTFAGFGLNNENTILINDMVAGARRLVSLVERGRIEASNAEPLHPSDRPPPKGNLVLVAPGTGLGTVGIVCEEDGSRARYVPVPCELQHTPIPSFDDDVARIVAMLRRDSGSAPSWEEVVSGRGLVNVYCRLKGLDRKKGRGGQISAEGVAKAALSSADEIAVDALSIYYRCAARYCQLVALSFMAAGGVFLGGQSSRVNADFVRHTGFAHNFRDNEFQHELLRRFPVWLLREDLNLPGALEMASAWARS